MVKTIGAYKLLTPLVTAGSGSARWAIASRGGERFFLKEFLSPVYPPAGGNPVLRKKQLQRCEAFEIRKQRLYSAMSCVIGDTLVPVVDFFRYEGRYYSISEEIPQSEMQQYDPEAFSAAEKRELLLSVALCLQRLHKQDVVHADLKPEHILLRRSLDSVEARLIDLDSGFLLSEPPQAGEMEGDPVYLAPEAFLRMAGEDVSVGAAIDTFAFGALIHFFWTGSLPEVDETCHYLYEAALSSASIQLNPALPREYRGIVHRMLDADPDKRPSDGELVRLLSRNADEGDGPQAMPRREDKPLNGLSRFMRK